MISKSIILALLLCATTISCIGVSPCPIPNHNGTVYSGIYSLYSGQIITGFNGGIVPLIEGQDSQCYNYSLPYAFSREPCVAVGTNIYWFSCSWFRSLKFE